MNDGDGWKRHVDRWAKSLSEGETEDVRHCRRYVQSKGYPEVSSLQIGVYLGHHKRRLRLERTQERIWRKRAQAE